MLKHHGLRGASREFRYFNIGVITGRENLGNLIRLMIDFLCNSVCYRLEYNE